MPTRRRDVKGQKRKLLAEKSKLRCKLEVIWNTELY